MARIRLIEPEQASPEVKEIYDKVLRGKLANVHKAMAHRPETLKTFLSFYPTVGRALDRKLYEAIYLRVSLLNNCHYWSQHHLASSKRSLTPEDWKALKTGDYGRFTEKERAALSYLEKLTKRPDEITDPDVDALKKHFAEPEIVDLHLLTGLANLTNRFTDPLGLEVEFPEEEI
jgi:alkylhydroperoxidase family enzyme